MNTVVAPTSAGPDLVRVPVPIGARVVAVALAIAVAVSAALGLLVDGVYHDPAPVVALFRGYDLVALTVAVPLLVVAFTRTSARAVLVWAGVLVYAIYNYSYYLFGAELTVLSVLHAAVFALAVVGLLLLARMDRRAIASRYRPRTPVRTVGAVLAGLGIALAVMWFVTMAQALPAGMAMREPSQLVVPTSFTHLGAVLDLALLVPAYLVAGVLLWRRAVWGHIAATALLVAGVMHQIAYMTALACQALHDIPGATAFDPAEPVILGIFTAAAAVMLYSCGAPPVPPTSARWKRRPSSAHTSP